MISLVTDPEFESLLAALSVDQLRLLGESLEAEGCRDPLVVWKGTILDGHNRYRICQEKGIRFRTAVAAVKNRSEAIAWIERNQLARRNLTQVQYTLILGRMYEREKLTPCGPATVRVDGQNGQQHTAKRIAKQVGVGEHTVRRAAKFYQQVHAEPEVEAKAMSGEIKTRAQAREALGIDSPLHAEPTNGQMRVGRVMRNKSKAPDLVCERAVGQIEIAVEVIEQHISGISEVTGRLAQCRTRISRILRQEG